jgi:hypothetical protein
MKEHAVQLTPDGHPDKPGWLNNLGNSLLSRFHRLGDLGDMNKSVLMKEHAVQLTPDGHPNKPGWLDSLGSSLLSRFQRLGDLGDMNNSVLMHQQSVQLTPDGHPDKPLRLNNLGHSLLSRFGRLGDLGDMNNSVLMHEHAVQLIPDGHSGKPGWLNNLGGSLLSRFERLGDLGDMNKSILMKECAVQLTPDGHPDKPAMLNNLGSSLLSRFERLGDLGDMNKSVLMHEHAVQLTPDGHPDKPLRLNNLGNSISCRFVRLGDLGDMNKSVLMLEHAVQLTPDGHPDKPLRLNNLGNSLLSRFKRLGDLDDINKSVLMFEHAIQLTPDGHSDMPLRLNNLGNSHLSCFDRLGNHKDLEAAISDFSLSASSGFGSISVRFHSSSMWASCAQLSHSHSVLDAYTAAFQLLPQLAWLGLSISDRHHHLLKVGVVVRNAVAAAIAAEKYETATEWLEQGRSIVWGQLLQLRNPVDHLQDKHLDLATKLQHLSKALEGTSDLNNFKLSSTTSQPLFHGSEKHYHELAHERDELLKKIQTLPGFETFLLPKTFSQLIPAACGGPVIMVNISMARCDALILLPDLNDILHIPLPNFTYLDAEDLKKSLYNMLKQRGVLRESDRHGKKADVNLANQEMEFANILSQLWNKVVRPILDGMAIMVCIYLMLTIPVSSLNIWGRIHPQLIHLMFGGLLLVHLHFFLFMQQAYMKNHQF